MEDVRRVSRFSNLQVDTSSSNSPEYDSPFEVEDSTLDKRNNATSNCDDDDVLEIVGTPCMGADTPAHAALGGNAFTVVKTWATLVEKKNSHWTLLRQSVVSCSSSRPVGDSVSAGGRKDDLPSASTTLQEEVDHAPAPAAEVVLPLAGAGQDQPQTTSETTSSSTSVDKGTTTTHPRPRSCDEHEEEEHGLTLTQTDQVTEELANGLLWKTFVQYCGGYKSHGEHVLQRPYFLQFIRDAQLLEGYPDSQVGKVQAGSGTPVRICFSF